MTARRLTVVAATFVLAGSSAFYATKHGHVPMPLVSVPIPPTEAAPEAPADWCAEGFKAIAGGCVAASRDPAQSLIVYLHGRYARDAAAEEIDRQRRLATVATTHGFSVIALRGDLGMCTAPELADWFCWPSNEHNASQAESTLSKRMPAIDWARTHTGARSLFLLGFSMEGISPA